MKSTDTTPNFTPAPANHRFLSSEQNSYQYANLYGFASELYDQIKNLQFSRSSPLLIISPSSEELVFLVSAAFLLRVPVITMHYESTEKEILQLTDKVEPAAIFATKDLESSRLKSIPHLDIPDYKSAQKKEWNNEHFSLSHTDETAGLFLTSGSSGSPKIVPVKRRQVLIAAHSSAKNFKPGKNKYWLLCLPLNHVGGINVIYRSLLYQSAIYIVQPFDELIIRELLYSNKDFEVASMVPTMLEKLMEDKLFRVHFDFKAILLGGGPITLPFIDRALTRGLPIVSSYGMTETCAQIAANPLLQPSGIYIPKTSVGKPFAPNRVEVRDEQGKSVLPNESGQIWLKGPQVFDGYFDPRLNKTGFDENGWFNTGDFGHMNRKGHLFIESRRTDLILTGGENVTPTEVETVLNDCPEIRESAVIGIPDQKWGQKVVAFISPANKNIDRKEVEKHLKKNLKRYQIPKELILIAAIPKTDLGKIKRKKLIQLYKSR